MLRGSGLLCRIFIGMRIARWVNRGGYSWSGLAGMGWDGINCGFWVYPVVFGSGGVPR